MIPILNKLLMKKYSFLGFLILLSCSSEFVVTGDHSQDFNRRLLNEIRIHSDPNKTLTEMTIGIIEINKREKVGLYFYKIYKNPSSVQAIRKVLKFKTKLVFPSGVIAKDSISIQEFENCYSSLFTRNQIDHIRKSFFLGTEISGRTL